MTFQQSLKLCRRRRPEVDPIPAFLVQLKNFEIDCRSLGYLTALDDADGTLLESGGSVKGREISANVNSDKRKKVSDDDTCSVRDVDKRRKVEGTSIGPSIGPTQPATVSAKASLKTQSIGPKRPFFGPSVGPAMPEKKKNGPYIPASAGEKLEK
mmetsp:Transcript_26300/g.53850  ORF Transcript_26300/g.53850 Transcript_26300/m.53850 type:complete len:155 (-) Transcript_26300:87-551(-)